MSSNESNIPTTEELKAQVVNPPNFYHQDSESSEPRELTQAEAAIVQKQIAEFKRHLKGLSKNELVRIVIDHTMTLYALQTKMKELSARFETPTEIKPEQNPEEKREEQ